MERRKRKCSITVTKHDSKNFGYEENEGRETDFRKCKQLLCSLIHRQYHNWLVRTSSQPVLGHTIFVLVSF